LMASFSEGGHGVTSNHVKTAALDSDFKSAYNLRPWYIGVSIIVAFAVAVWLGTLIPRQQEVQTKSAGTEPSVEISAMPGSNAAVGVMSVTEPVSLEGQSTETEAVVVNEVMSNMDAVTGDKNILLKKSLERTEIWRGAASSGHYTIQLFLARHVDGEAVENFLQNAPAMLDLEKIYVYETVIGGRRKYSVLYNEYASQSEAQARLDSLPEALRVSQPFLRRVDTIASQPHGT
jgi:septal ring-binding cell division protein DamX